MNSDSAPNSGGSAGSGGYDFQARVIAYVTAHIVSERRLDWLDDRDDVPIAVSAETSGPADDVQIEFAFGHVDGQIKRGLDLTGLREVIARFTRALTSDPSRILLLIVDDTSSATIRTHLRLDLRRVAQGRRDHLKTTTNEILKVIAEAGAVDPYHVASRIHVIDLSLETEGAASQKVALALLREVLLDEDHRRAWTLLITEAHRLQKYRGRRDRPGLLGLLTAERLRLTQGIALVGVAVPTNTSPQPRGQTVAGGSGSETDPWNRRIDDGVSLIKAGQAKSALKLLEQLLDEARRTPDVKTRIFYRLHTNLAACHVELNELGAAERVLHTALDYEDGDTTARASLAQVRLAQGRKGEALDLAKQVLDRTPHSVTGWLVRIQASDAAVSEETIPPDIAQDFQILAARALAAYRRGDAPSAVDLLKGALQRRRDAQVLVLLGQALFALGSTADIPRYLDEAIEALSTTDRGVLLEQALLLRGVLLTKDGQHATAKGFFDRAAALQGHSWKVEAAVARNHIAMGRQAAALAVLDGVHAPEGQTDVVMLKAFANVGLSRPDEVRRHLKAVLDEASRNDDPVDILLSAAEAAIHAGLDDLGQTALERVPSDEPDFRNALLRARLESRRGDSGAARASYFRALQTVPRAQRDRLQFEVAEYLERLGDYPAAIEAYEQGGVAKAAEVVRRDYARALFQAKEASRVLTFLREEETGGPLPGWGIELRARIALEREDWPGAIEALDSLLTIAPEDPWVVLKLVEALLHEGLRDRVPALILRLIKRVDLESDALMAAAHLLGDFPYPVEALESAYRAVRKEPDNPELRLAYVKSFLDAEKAGHPGLKPEAVGADTWVRLRSSAGDSREYLVVRSGPVDIQRSELLSTDDRATKLLGRLVGDRITFREGALDETEVEVVEIKSAAVRLFQQTLAEFRVWFPENTSLQAFPVGEGRLDELVPILSQLQGRANFVDEVLKLYDTSIPPLGFMAVALGTSVRSVYNSRTQQPSARLFVETGNPAELVAARDAAASAKVVVLTTSALLTWKQLERLDLLHLLFPDLVVPQSLLDELDRDAKELTQSEQGAATMAWVNPDFARFWEKRTRRGAAAELRSR